MRKRRIKYRDAQGKRFNMDYASASAIFSVELLQSVMKNDTQSHQEVIEKWISRGLEVRDVVGAVAALLTSYGAQEPQHGTVYVAIRPETHEEAEDPLQGLEGLKAPKPVRVSFMRRVIGDVRVENRKRKRTEAITVIENLVRKRRTV